MGAVLSYLGYASHQQLYHRSLEHTFQHLHQGHGPNLIFGKGDAAMTSTIDLYTCIATLEKDLQMTRGENTNKEAVIQYLLQYSLSDTRAKEIAARLKQQLRILSTNQDRLKKEIDEIKDRLGKAEAIIFTLSTPGVPSSRSQCTSTLFSSRSDSPPAEDLIDLLVCNQDPDGAKLREEDRTSLDEFLGDESDVEEVLKNTTPDQSLHQSFDAEFEASSYIVHFANSDEDAEYQDTVKNSTTVLLQEGLG